MPEDYQTDDLAAFRGIFWALVAAFVLDGLLLLTAWCLFLMD